jgi:hypothetical protein
MYKYSVTLSVRRTLFYKYLKAMCCISGAGGSNLDSYFKENIWLKKEIGEYNDEKCHQYAFWISWAPRKSFSC